MRGTQASQNVSFLLSFYRLMRLARIALIFLRKTILVRQTILLNNCETRLTVNPACTRTLTYHSWANSSSCVIYSFSFLPRRKCISHSSIPAKYEYLCGRIDFIIIFLEGFTFSLLNIFRHSVHFFVQQNIWPPRRVRNLRSSNCS